MKWLYLNVGKRKIEQMIEDKKQVKGAFWKWNLKIKLSTCYILYYILCSNSRIKIHVENNMFSLVKIC